MNSRVEQENQREDVFAPSNIQGLLANSFSGKYRLGGGWRGGGGEQLSEIEKLFKDVEEAACVKDDCQRTYVVELPSNNETYVDNQKALVPYNLTSAFNNLTLKRKLEKSAVNVRKRDKSGVSNEELVRSARKKVERKRVTCRRRKGVAKRKMQVVNLGVEELFEIYIEPYLGVLKGCGGWPKLVTR